MKEQFQIINSQDAPWMRVKPDFSNLEENPKVTWKFKERYPNLYFDQACLVDGNILIQDVGPQIRRLVH